MIQSVKEVESNNHVYKLDKNSQRIGYLDGDVYSYNLY
jgi:hypothetical protein